MSDLYKANLSQNSTGDHYDLFTRMAMKFLHAPFATISLLITNRQWFKTCIGIEYFEADQKDSFYSHTIQQGGPFIIEDAILDERFADNSRVVNFPYIRFYAGYPLHDPKGHRIGALSIFDTQLRIFSDEERDLLRELAFMAGKSFQIVDLIYLQKSFLAAQEQLLQSRERLVQETKQAVQFVSSLLPQELNGPIQTRHFYEPSSELGGDCFYYHWLNQDCFVFYTIDVAGHGVSAALLAISILNALNAYMKLQPELFSSDRALEVLNSIFPMATQGNRFTTAWLGVYRPSLGILEYSCAGHPPPFLLRRNGAMGISFLATNELPLGISQNQKYQSHQIPLGLGDRILIFSDGVYESNTIENDPGHYDAFAQDVLKTYEGNNRPLDILEERYFTKKSGLPFKDDLTLVEIQFNV